MIRKWLTVILMCFLLIGCQNERTSPEEVFDQFMIALKRADLETMATYLDTELQMNETIEKWLNTKEIKEQLQEIFENTEYTIVESNTVLPEATLTIRIKTKDYGKLVEDMYASLLTSYLMNPDKDLQEEGLDLLEDKLENYSLVYQKEINVYFIYDNGWKIDSSKNEMLIEALTGGAYTKLKSFLS